MAGEGLTHERVARALAAAVSHLRAARGANACWEGRLASSALSTATAASTLSLAQPSDASAQAGARWLTKHQNQDGGWGDTTDSPSNISTSLLAVAALRLAQRAQRTAGTARPKDEKRHEEETTPPQPPLNEGGEGAALARAEEYLTRHAGATQAQRREALLAAYHPDRTFAVPILTNLALAGVISWKGIPHLPFELAVLPRAWLRLLRLQVVSYALPALIAIGLCLEHHRPSRCPVRRTLRWGCRRSVLALLQDIQPASGGFLEAVPLTSFVAMSLLPLYGPQQPVVKKCLEFLKRLARPDGSWPIDTNLSVWVTTRALEALDSAGALDAQDETAARKWLLALQHQHAHPFTMAEPGAWSWTHLSGGVPDADDTPGALIALSKLGKDEAAQQAGLGWLLDLQNDNGGWPTFCRGWGKLPFDRSAADITAHVLRALRACDAETHDAYALAAAKRAMAYLESSQRPDGSWLPLWFGNQYAPGLANPVYGTARVLRALAERAPEGHAAARGVEWLLGAQNPDGGWGGNKGVHSTVEESALAVTGLMPWISRAEVRAAVERGVEYLVRRVEDGAWTQPAPIGLYFARLWYSEELYPVVWTVEALGRYLKGRA